MTNVVKHPSSNPRQQEKKHSKLWCLFGVHSYVLVNQGPFEKRDSNGFAYKRCRYYDSRCSVCGKMKQVIM